MSNESKVIPNKLEPTSKLIVKLCSGRVGDIITDDELEECCGRKTSCGNNGYGLLQTAIKRALNDKNIVWMRIRGENKIKCINSEEISEVIKTEMKTINRRAKRTVKKSTAINMSDITDDKKAEILAYQAQMGTIYLMSKTSAQKRLQEAKIEKPLDMTNMLSMFTK